MDQDGGLTGLLIDTMARVDNNRRGHVVADLAIFTILIDAGLLTIQQACERLELIQSSLGENYQTDEAKLRTQQLIEWLRAHEKPGPRGWSPRVIQGGKDQS